MIDIDQPGNMETAIAADINGDGQQDILPNIGGLAAWYEFKRDASAKQSPAATRESANINVSNFLMIAP